MSDAGGPKVGLMNIGEEAKPPFAVLPDPGSLFLGRSRRLAALAPTHELRPYLEFLSRLTFAQHETHRSAPPFSMPTYEDIERAGRHGMPPLAGALVSPDEVMTATALRFLEHLGTDAVPAQTATAIAALHEALATRADATIAAVLRNEPSTLDTAQHVLLLAALQVHFSGLAARLTAEKLRPVAEGVCPTCGSSPMVSTVVGWPRAHNTRYCTCWLCATMWNVVRIKCVLCGATGGISYRTIEGRTGSVKAETCDTCRAYVKILYQVDDPVLEPLADDVASLGLDILLTEEGWRRGGKNPFLLGY